MTRTRVFFYNRVLGLAATVVVVELGRVLGVKGSVNSL